jgi:hypothetical protein
LTASSLTWALLNQLPLQLHALAGHEGLESRISRVFSSSGPRLVGGAGNSEIREKKRENLCVLFFLIEQ